MSLLATPLLIGLAACTPTFHSLVIPHPETFARVPIPSDDALRQLLRNAAPRFLEASPGRGLPMDLPLSSFRYEIWPRIDARCAQFENESSSKLPTPELLAIAADEHEDPRAREMSLWLLAARIFRIQDQGRPAKILQLPPLHSDELPNLAQTLAPYLESSDRVTRVSAVVVVGTHAGPDAAHILVRTIKSPFLPERLNACWMIGRFGTPGLGVEGLALLRPFIYDRPETAMTPAAAQALLLAGTADFERGEPPVAIEELLHALRYAPRAGEPRDRKELTRWDDPSAEFTIGFKDEEIMSGRRAEAFIRCCAAASLAQLDIHELQLLAFKPMLEALRDREIGVVYNAFRFLDRVGIRSADWGATPTLEAMIRSGDAYFSEAAILAVWSWGERLEPLIPAVIARTDANIAARRDIFFHIWTLGNSDDPRAEQYLIALAQRLGPGTRPLDEEGNEVDTDARYRKLIDDGLARHKMLRDLKTGADLTIQEKALDDSLRQPRPRYLVPTLLEIVKDPARPEKLRVRCAESIQALDPVAAPAWFAEILPTLRDPPPALQRILERGRLPRPSDE